MEPETFSTAVEQLDQVGTPLCSSVSVSFVPQKGTSFAAAIPALTLKASAQDEILLTPNEVDAVMFSSSKLWVVLRGSTKVAITPGVPVKPPTSYFFRLPARDIAASTSSGLSSAGTSSDVIPDEGKAVSKEWKRFGKMVASAFALYWDAERAHHAERRRNAKSGHDTESLVAAKSVSKPRSHANGEIGPMDAAHGAPSMTLSHQQDARADPQPEAVHTVLPSHPKPATTTSGHLNIDAAGHHDHGHEDEDEDGHTDGGAMPGAAASVARTGRTTHRARRRIKREAEAREAARRAAAAVLATIDSGSGSEGSEGSHSRPGSAQHGPARAIATRAAAADVPSGADREVAALAALVHVAMGRHVTLSGDRAKSSGPATISPRPGSMAASTGPASSVGSPVLSPGASPRPALPHLHGIRDDASVARSSAYSTGHSDSHSYSRHVAHGAAEHVLNSHARAAHQGPNSHRYGPDERWSGMGPRSGYRGSPSPGHHGQYGPGFGPHPHHHQPSHLRPQRFGPSDGQGRHQAMYNGQQGPSFAPQQPPVGYIEGAGNGAADVQYGAASQYQDASTAGQQQVPVQQAPVQWTSMPVSAGASTGQTMPMAGSVPAPVPGHMWIPVSMGGSQVQAVSSDNAPEQQAGVSTQAVNAMAMSTGQQFMPMQLPWAMQAMMSQMSQMAMPMTVVGPDGSPTTIQVPVQMAMPMAMGTQGANGSDGMTNMGTGVANMGMANMQGMAMQQGLQGMMPSVALVQDPATGNIMAVQTMPVWQ